eukprot:12498672-Ditylum_brightwellii.AAC.1
MHSKRRADENAVITLCGLSLFGTIMSTRNGKPKNGPNELKDELIELIEAKNSIDEPTITCY